MALDISNCSTNLGDDDVGITVALSGRLESPLNLVRDMGDELNGGTEVFTRSLVFYDVFKDLPRTQAVDLGKVKSRSVSAPSSST